MSHRHSHHHPGPTLPRASGAPPRDYRRAFLLGVTLNLLFVVVEAVAGFLSGSLALVTDAGHNLSDVLGLVLAWGAAVLASRPPTERRTYGYRKSSILAALFNALLLLAVGAIGWEAVRRLGDPRPVEGTTVSLIALVGLIINGATALLFRHGRHTDLNIRGAFLHMAADAAVSAGVVVAGVLIALTGRTWIDPIVSLAIAGIIVAGTWGLLRESLDLALDAVPPGIDPDAIRRHLCALPGITGVHDLHVWAMSTTEIALTAHLVKPDPDDDDALMARLTSELHDRYGIGHVTVQWERGGAEAGCADCESEV